MYTCMHAIFTKNNSKYCYETNIILCFQYNINNIYTYRIGVTFLNTPATHLPAKKAACFCFILGTEAYNTFCISLYNYSDKACFICTSKCKQCSLISCSFTHSFIHCSSPFTMWRPTLQRTVTCFELSTHTHSMTWAPTLSTPWPSLLSTRQEVDHRCQWMLPHKKDLM